VHVDGEERGERQKRVALEKLQGGSVQFPDEDLGVKNFGGLLELGPSLGKPQGHPLPGAALDEMRVLVMNGRIRVFSGGIQQDQYIFFSGVRKNRPTMFSWPLPR
jgi:hypothetical protein